MVDVLVEFARTLHGEYDISQILDRLTARLPDVLPVDGAGVMLEDGAGTLRFAAASDDVVRLIETLQVELGDGPCVAAYRTGERVLLPDLSDSDAFPSFCQRAMRQGIAAVYSFPMWHDGQRLGALDAYSAIPGQLTKTELDAGQTLADVATSYLLNARQRERSRQAEEELRWHSITDSLTGLPNRRLLVDHLELALTRSRRSGLKVGVLFLDLDRFKVVNDSLGHAAGDLLLVEVASRLRSAVRPSDTAGRLGGDEFAVICEDLHDADDILRVAARVLTALETPVELHTRELVITPSVGVAIGAGGTTDVDMLLANADAAMYRAKDRGRGRVELFDREMHDQAMDRLDLDAGIRHALAENELRLEYQPLIDLTSRQITGVEALLRWQHPTRGLLQPDEFIPLAEDNRLIVPIGRWVLTEACRQAAHWRRLGLLPERFRMSVNLSPAQLADPLLLDTFAAAALEYQLPADSVCFEITEQMLVQDAEAPISALHALKTLGAQVAVDDFGTGYSSFAYLTRFPLDQIKVDQSFVAAIGLRPQTTAVVEAIVNLAHTLRLVVVAEGVETAAQLTQLQRMGCDAAQGHLFHASSSPGEITDLLLRHEAERTSTAADPSE